MSRIAKSPIRTPAGVEIDIKDGEVRVKGPKGSLALQLHPNVSLEKDEDQYVVSPASDGDVAMAGTFRSLVNNMVVGVTKGFEKKLSLVGVGYKAQAQGAKLNLTVGYSHPVNKDMPAGITVATPTPTEIVIKGADRQRVGQVAAEIRAIRPPEPYKGKGIRYSDEKITIKETKKK